MQLRIFTLVSLSLVLNACLDEGTIGKEASGVGGRTNVTPASGGSSSPATGGTTSTGGANTAGASGDSSIHPLFAATLSSCGIEIISTPTTQADILPLDLLLAEPRAKWQALLDNCVAGGWDLTPCAGREVVVTSAETDQTQPGSTLGTALPVSVNVITEGDRVCCVTRTYAAPGGVLPAMCAPMTTAAKAMADCAIPEVAHLGVLEMDIPIELAGPNWSLKSEVCTAGGWNLAQCAGGPATFSSFDTGTRGSSGSPLTAWVVTKGSSVCCIYESEANSNPGLSSVACAKAP